MNFNHATQQHLRFIDVMAQYNGVVHVEPLVAYFGLSTSTGTRVFRQYQKLRPDNLVYDPSIRRYVKTSDFKPLFNNSIDGGDSYESVGVGIQYKDDEEYWGVTHKDTVKLRG